MQTKHILLTAAAILLLGACSEAENPNRVVGELASDRVELTAEVAEPIVTIAVAEGAHVKAGEILVQQNSDRANSCRPSLSRDAGVPVRK